VDTIDNLWEIIISMTAASVSTIHNT
jgi:hypothetical protein